MRGRCPYHHDVLILDTMLALKHARYFQRIELNLGFLWFRRLEEHLNMVHLFLLTKLVETCAQKFQFIKLGTFACILSHIWNKNQGM